MSLDPIPEDAAASPVDAPWLNVDSPWYKPSLAQTAALLGWRWLYCLPVLLLLLLLLFYPGLFLQLFIYGWKLLVFLVALPIIAFLSSARHAIRNRKDPFCIHCGYSLVGLPDGHRCPECGQPFRLSVIEEYRRDPAFFIKRLQAARKHPKESAPFAAGPQRRKGKSRDGT